ncbi:MAG: FecR domain-containing protein [Kiritimatiellae bacterium]|nr:FecR domain-containing protein [Kiritimatiellia bacterium]MDD5520213.1 FecR domain-containing protein [Kiritimatiellia bacterium]
MKSRIWSIIVIGGLILLGGLTVVLTRSLFKMSIDSNRIKTGETANVTQKSLIDTIIEIGKEPRENAPSRTTDRPKVTQYSSGQMSGQQKPAVRGPIGKVTYLSGIASVADQTGKAYLLMLNNDISQMDRIETGPNTKLEIKFVDGTVVSQGEKSVIIIEECMFNQGSPAGCGFVLRFNRGICRVVTGLIADVNPYRFKVRTKTVTVGIRGCDLVFKSTPSRDDIFVLDMARTKSIELETTCDGTPITDTDTGVDLAVDDTNKRHISLTAPQTAVSIVSGKEPEKRNIGTDEIKRLISETSRLRPARYELQQKANGAIFTITPDKTADQTDSSSKKE